jgi:formate hydrogenlyase subunit 3/multisubunit Na+/H+ antiporter MnhD subunit
MSFITAIYAAGYMKSSVKTSSFFFFLNILTASMLLVVVIQNAIAFLIVWEIMSLSSFFLVAFENEKEEVYQASINYLIAMHIGLVFMICAFILLTLRSGSLDFNSFKAVFTSNKEFANLLFILFFIGFGTKAGFIPLHTWLPKAHPAAPSPVSGMMSGIMIKTGIYGILRILFLMGVPSKEISYFVLIISIISAGLGVFYALAQRDLKRLLAYSSVENIGIIGMGVGAGMLGLSYDNPLMAVLGFSGAILHILNHSLFKGLLFFSAGSVYLGTHSRDMEKLGGLIKKMPYTAFFFLIGSLAISGLPPFNGFVSEFLIYTGLFNGLKSPSLLLIASVLSIASLALIGGVALLCFTKAFGIVFLGVSRSDKGVKAVESPGSMLFPLAILSLFCVLIGLLPQYFIRLVNGPVKALTGGNEINMNGNLFSLFNTISIAFFVFIAFVVLLFLLRKLLLAKKPVSSYKTWDCGYQAGNARMQYTASSYAEPFLALVKPFINFQRRIEKPSGLFPKGADFESKDKDWVSVFFIQPAVRGISKFLDLFSWIQSGNTQQYILYGLIFLVLALFWIIGVK